MSDGRDVEGSPQIARDDNHSSAATPSALSTSPSPPAEVAGRGPRASASPLASELNVNDASPSPISSTGFPAAATTSIDRADFGGTGGRTEGRRRLGNKEEAAEISSAVERIFESAWTPVPLLRALPLDRRAELNAGLDALLSSRAWSGAGELLMRIPSSRAISLDHDALPAQHGAGVAAGHDDAVLGEHFRFLRALDHQLQNAVAGFDAPDPNQGDGEGGNDAVARNVRQEDKEGEVEDGGPSPGSGGTLGGGAGGQTAASTFGGFTYDKDHEVVREWGGTVLEAGAPQPKVPRDGLSPPELDKVVGILQWIRGVLEGARRVHHLVLDMMPVPDPWTDALPVNAKEAIGVHLYNDLSDVNFDAARVADAEGYTGARGSSWTRGRGGDGADVSRTGGGACAETSGTRGWDRSGGQVHVRGVDHTGASGSGVSPGQNSKPHPAIMSDVDAWKLLDTLEMAEAVWASKRQDQEVLDQLHPVGVDLSGAASTLTFGLIGSPSPGRVGGRGRRAQDLARRTAAAAALRRTLYARYPSVGLTSLEAMKVRHNDDTALAVLEAYARALVKTAAQLRERARDVVYAHFAARGEPCPLDGECPGVATGGLVRRVLQGARLAFEWAYDVSRAARLETEALVGFKASDIGALACCGAPPDQQRPTRGSRDERGGG